MEFREDFHFTLMSMYEYISDCDNELEKLSLICSKSHTFLALKIRFILKLSSKSKSFDISYNGIHN